MTRSDVADGIGWKGESYYVVIPISFPESIEIKIHIVVAVLFSIWVYIARIARSYMQEELRASIAITALALSVNQPIIVQIHCVITLNARLDD